MDMKSLKKQNEVVRPPRTVRFYQRNSGRIKVSLLLIAFVTFATVVAVFYTNLFSPPTPKVQEAHAQISLVQTNSAVTNRGDSVNVTYGVVPIQNNLLVAIAGNRDGCTLSSPPVNWSIALDQSNNAPGQIILYKIAGESESQTFSFTYDSGCNTRHGIHIYEYSGIDT